MLIVRNGGREMRFEGKVAVVTGAGGGIGRQLVLQLLERGACVAAVDISKEALAETEKCAVQFSDKISLHVTDITDREQVNALPPAVERRHGHIDILINNAGIIQPFVPLSDLDGEMIQRVMNVNVFGPIFMTRAFLPYLAKREEAHIANVSSMGAFLPVPGQTLYGASKAAVKLLTEGLRAELAHSKIGVSVIMPGAVNTNITKNSGVQLAASGRTVENLTQRITPPNVAARIILNGIRKGRPRILVGPDAQLMDLLTRLAPVRAAKLVGKLMSSLLDGHPRDLEPA